MGWGDTDKLIAGLEGHFAAAVAAEDDIAADDLAFSLAQDLQVEDDLTRIGGAVVIGDVRRAVDAVAEDFLVAGDWLVPLTRAVVEVGAARPARSIPEVLLGRLRSMARAQAEVSVGVGSNVVGGRLVRAGAAHVVVQSRRSVAVPLSRLEYVRRVSGGSADVP